jgi:hypothetical protein
MPPGTPRGAPWVFGREVVLAGEPGAARAAVAARAQGRLLRPELRAAFARELRQALRQRPAMIPPATEPN